MWGEHCGMYTSSPNMLFSAHLPFRSVQEGICVLRKVHNFYAVHPVSQTFPQRCLWLKQFQCSPDWRWSFQGKSSSASSFRSSVSSSSTLYIFQGAASSALLYPCSNTHEKNDVLRHVQDKHFTVHTTIVFLRAWIFSVFRFSVPAELASIGVHIAAMWNVSENGIAEQPNNMIITNRKTIKTVRIRGWG